MLPLPLLVLIARTGMNSGIGGGSCRDAMIMSRRWVHIACLELNRNSHVASVSSFPSIAFVFADTAIDTDTGIFAPLARTLAIATLFALAASLAAWFARQVFFVNAQLVLEVDRRDRRFA